MFSQLKLYLAIGALAAFGILYYLYSSAVAENELLTVQYNQVVARTERDKIKMQEMAATAEANEVIRQEAADRVENNIAHIQVLEKEMATTRRDNDELAKMLSKNKLKMLINKNQSRMQLRMRNATERLFNEFEAATARGSTGL